MKTEYTISEALESNLKLIVDGAIDLADIFAANTEQKNVYERIAITGAVLLARLQAGKFNGIEKEMFDATLPLCQRICQRWHKYSFLL